MHTTHPQTQKNETPKTRHENKPSQLAPLTYFTYMLTSLFGCMWSFCLVIWGLGSHAVNQKSMHSYEFGQLNTLFFSTCDQTISHWWFFFQPNTWGVSCSFGPPASKCTESCSTTHLRQKLHKVTLTFQPYIQLPTTIHRWRDP